MNTPDIVLVHPNAARRIYQDLSVSLSAIEPPIWAGMLANHCRQQGYAVELLDCEALYLDEEQSALEILGLNARLICIVVYGQQPSASSQNMSGAIQLAETIKSHEPQCKIMLIGGHVSALPLEVMQRHNCIDMVAQNEGVYTLSHLLAGNLSDHLDKVPGLGWRDTEGNTHLNTASPIVTQNDLPTELPGVAWDLLPIKNYRTSLWHSLPNNCERQPFAAIYTSLGCPMKCSFCMINIINRQDNQYADGSAVFRYWDPQFMIGQLDQLAEMGITNIKIADELFVLNQKHFHRLCELIIEHQHNFNIWCYARIDTIKERHLEILKRAGVNWLALGIESGVSHVRKDVTKGRFEDVNIADIVGKIRDHGINVIANYIFGLPEDDHKSMQATLDLALSLNTEAANFYSAMAYPGSPLYGQAKENGWDLPEDYTGYSQHAYETLPLPTKYLTAAEVLAFRDKAWETYHTSKPYLELLESNFGKSAVEQTLASTEIKLKRKILGHTA